MKINGVGVPAKQKSPLHTASELDCGSFYLTLHEYSPGWEDEWHSHPEAQFGHVLAGAMRVWIEGKLIEQTEGDSVFIPGGLMHRSAAPAEKTVALNLYVKPVS